MENFLMYMLFVLITFSFICFCGFRFYKWNTYDDDALSAALSISVIVSLFNFIVIPALIIGIIIVLPFYLAFRGIKYLANKYGW